jgi:hypothetical protein
MAPGVPQQQTPEQHEALLEEKVRTAAHAAGSSPRTPLPTP